MFDIDQLKKRKPFLQKRGRLLSHIRQFFENADFLEVSTPVWIDAPAPEAYIEAPSVESRGFLRTSPELEMKMLLVAGYERIFQIGPCFREGEMGRLHRPEFTMLEWYQKGITYRQLMDFTGHLISFVAESLLDHGQILFKPKYSSESFCLKLSEGWDELSVFEAFQRYAGEDVNEVIKRGCYEEVLVEKVEPHLGLERPLFLIDYPPECAAFSQMGTQNTCERWELYIGGIEIANAYGELTDPLIQRQRFNEFSKQRASYGGKPYPEAIDFLSAMDMGLPQCSGCALGIDRLAMIFSGVNEIEWVQTTIL